MNESSENHKKTNYYEYPFKNVLEADITFNVKGQVIKAHKVVLGSSNPVFLEVFTSQPTLQQIEIPFLDPKAFRIYMRYLYTGKVSDENVTDELLLVAHNYLDSNLMNICREKLRKIVTAENVIMRLDAFIKCQDDEMVEELSSYVIKNYNDLKHRCEFQQSNLTTTNAILTAFDYFDPSQGTILTEYRYPSSTQLYDSAKRSDLTIKVQDHSFLAHKEILSTRNTVFETVISALPTTSNVVSTINIPDFDPTTFKIFLIYIYRREVIGKITGQLMNVAHEYVEEELLKICEEYLCKTLRNIDDDAVLMLILATNIGNQKLEEKASKWIVDRFEQMKLRTDFQTLKQNPKAVDAVFSQFSFSHNCLENYKSCREIKGMNFLLKLPLTAGRVYSETFYLRGIPWKIYFERKYDNLEVFEPYLQCMDISAYYRHRVCSSLTIISRVNKTNDMIGVIEEFVATNLEFISAYPHFLSLNDKEKHFISNGKVKVSLDAK